MSLAFDDATFSLSDSIMPLMRLKMEAMPPGLQVSATWQHGTAVESLRMSGLEGP